MERDSQPNLFFSSGEKEINESDQVRHDLSGPELRLSVDSVDERDRHLADAVAFQLRPHNHLHLENVPWRKKRRRMDDDDDGDDQFLRETRRKVYGKTHDKVFNGSEGRTR